MGVATAEPGFNTIMDPWRSFSSSSSVSADIETSESDSDSLLSIVLAISAGSWVSLIVDGACIGESAEVESADEESELSWDASLADVSILRSSKTSDDIFVLVVEKVSGN